MKKVFYLLFILVVITACNKDSDKTGTFSGLLQFESGEAIPFTLVLLKSNDVTIMQTTSDDDGKFKFSEVPYGDYSLICYHDTYKTSKPVSITLNSELVDDFDLIFTPNISILGKVLIGGYPYPSNKVELYDNKKIEIKGETYLDLESNFSFYDLPEGVYYIKISVTQDHLYRVYGYLWNGSSWVWGPFDIETFDVQDVFYAVQIESTATREVVLNINWDGSEFVVNEK